MNMKSLRENTIRASSPENPSPWEAPRGGGMPRPEGAYTWFGRQPKPLKWTSRAAPWPSRASGTRASMQHASGEELIGMKLVAATDSKGGVYNPRGIDTKALIDHKIRTGSLNGFADTDAITNKELLELETSVLFPAALENVITKENASKIRCAILCELANGPTTPDADDILYEKGIFVLPDFLANAGGVTVSYLEQVQNTYNLYWNLDEIHFRLKDTMRRAFESVYEMSRKSTTIHMRNAAYLVAVARVAEACKLRGWV